MTTSSQKTMNPFVALMKQIESAGTFSAFDKLDPIFPGIVIDNVGDISLPLSEYQAKKIIEQCELAPFGRGEKTILDTNVRNVWQISPAAIQFTNPDWDQAITKACKNIGNQLGLTDCKIDFELYKVLVYAEGSFFKEHRDTEKIPNMFATMVVNLPSAHEGGELIVRHGGAANRYSFAGKSKFHAEFAAFYADCYHEVKPITSGYRFSLIYNLAIADRKQQPLLSYQAKIVDQLEIYLKNWSQEVNDQPILTYLLDHSYSEENLSITNLKNNDFAKASTLLKLAEKNQCKAFLCLVSYNRESYGDCGYYGRGYKSRRNYVCDDEDSEISESSFEEYDVSHEETYAHFFIDLHGQEVDVKKLILDDDHILAEIPLCEGPGREVSISEATGNSGATKELWYHRGAIILWPDHKDFEILTKIDIGYSVHNFKRLIQTEDISEVMNRQKAIKIAHHIINSQNYDAHGFSLCSRLFDLNEIIEDLIVLADPGIFRNFLKIQSVRGLKKLPPKLIVQIFEQFSWHTFDNDMSVMLTKYETSHQAVEALEWLLNVLLQKPKAPESYQMITKWFERIQPAATSLTHVDEAKKGLSSMFQILSLLQNEQLTDEVLQTIHGFQKLETLPCIFSPALIEALNAGKKEAGSIKILEKIVEAFLNSAKASYDIKPQPPANWSRTGKLKCSCSFCTDINNFLPDPNSSGITFKKTLKRNLEHMETEFLREHLDLSIGIERQSSGFNGTVRKNQNAYEKALKRYVVVEETKNAICRWRSEIGV